jgi:putative nucleotidyltransferase with HDIG domain
MHQLLVKIFSEPFLSAFCKNPAGMKMHHAYMGGLLKHTVDVTKLALAIAEAEGGADKDMVIAGALLHDIGKVKEISSGVGFPYTTEGRLLGHISISAQMVKKTAEEMSLPWSQVQFLEHVILSHHGEQDKGSPVACATKEAFIVHYADEIDAVLNQFADPDRHHSWTFNKMLQRYLAFNYIQRIISLSGPPALLVFGRVGSHEALSTLHCLLRCIFSGCLLDSRFFYVILSVSVKDNRGCLERQTRKVRAPQGRMPDNVRRG